MTNDEYQMTKEIRNPKSEKPHAFCGTLRIPGLGFLSVLEIRHSGLVIHSSFIIRHPDL